MVKTTGRLVMVLIMAGPLAVLPADPRDRGPDTIDVSTWPEKQQEQYKTFTVKCSKCHSLSRAINAKLKADEWKLYVKKMKRRAGSGITDTNAEVLSEFLAYYSAVREGRAPAPAENGAAK
ncbi:MAG: hypothetical protein JNJ54_12215 [Myxococcaceae bacterium]|nr:hypothetical protein [Myxococcaceae bacterium]